MDEKIDYSHFVCIVAGDNPEELIKQYAQGNNQSSHIVYKFSDASVIKQNYIRLYTTLINSEADEWKRALYEEELAVIKEDTDSEFFAKITEEYDHDGEGNAIDFNNPNAKFVSYNIGKALSVPFLLYDSTEAYTAIKGDIDWDKIHMSPMTITPYQIAWETVIEKKKPETPYENMVYNNMKDLSSYLMKFKNKETYIASCCSFWGYAFLSQETGWRELEGNMNQFEWVSCFYEKFIVPLPENTRLTIYECRKY